jgi:hypothetical protein
MRARLRYHPGRITTALAGEIAGAAADIGSACHELTLAPLQGREPCMDHFEPDIWAQAVDLFESAQEWIYSRLLTAEQTDSVEADRLPPEFQITKDYGDGRPLRHNFIVPVSDRYAISGAWDQCGINESGDRVIPDLKSGRVVSSSSLLRQGTLYCYAAWAIYPAHERYVFDSVFMRFRNRPPGAEPVSFQAKDMGEVRRLIVEDIEETDALLLESRPRFNEYCGSCPLRQGCIAAQAELRENAIVSPALQVPGAWGSSETYDQQLHNIEKLVAAERERVKSWQHAQATAGGVIVDGMEPYLREKPTRYEIPIGPAIPIALDAGIPGEAVFACRSKTAIKALGKDHPDWKPAIERMVAMSTCVKTTPTIDWRPVAVWPCLPDNPPVVEPMQDALGLPPMVATTHQLTEAPTPPASSETVEPDGSLTVRFEVPKGSALMISPDVIREAEPAEKPKRGRRPNPVHSCGRKCKWTGTGDATAYCPACGETFTPIYINQGGQE